MAYTKIHAIKATVDKGHACEKEVRELSRKLENLNQYLGRDTVQSEAAKLQNKSL